MKFDSEDIEKAALIDLHRAASPEIIKSLQLKSLSIGSGFVSISGVLPETAIVINRSIGLGLGTAETKASIQKVTTAYDLAGVDEYFVQIHPDAQPKALTNWLLEAGLIKTRGWQKFSRGNEPVPEIKCDLSVKEIDSDHGEAFARIVCNAFDLGELAIPWLAKIPGRDGWYVFMSFDGDQAAGSGALYIQGQYAWCDFGATAPEFRRRGSQGALLAHRVRFALDAGCTEIFTCTGEDVPGDPQHSYKNIQRIGFKETYLRENYAPADK